MTKSFHVCNECNEHVKCECIDYITSTWGLCHKCLKSNVIIKDTFDIQCENCV